MGKIHIDIGISATFIINNNNKKGVINYEH